MANPNCQAERCCRICGYCLDCDCCTCPNLTDQVEMIYSLFESCCPTCGTHVRITHVGGTKQFFEDHDHLRTGTHSWSEWRERDPNDPYDAGEAVGGIEFKCTHSKCQRKFYIEQLACSDWAI